MKKKQMYLNPPLRYQCPNGHQTEWKLRETVPSLLICKECGEEMEEIDGRE